MPFDFSIGFIEEHLIYYCIKLKRSNFMKIDKNKLIIVTGGAGFIGSSVIRHLNDKGITNIVVVDELGHSEKWKNLVGKQFLEILEKDELFSWLESKESLISAFIHLGACSSTVETNASYLLENNTKFSIRLAEYALKHNHRFIYASSAATYGDGSFGFSDDEVILNQLRPLNMYGFSKQLFDLWAKNQGVLNRIVGLKYFNVFGPNEGHKGRMASAVFHLLDAVKKNGKVQLFKSEFPDQFAHGEQKRDFIYVKDAARMTCSFLENNAGGIYNIGMGEASTWNQLAEALFKALELPANIEYVDMPHDLMGKYQNYTCADMRKTKNVLKENAKCAHLEDSVIDYVRNHLLNNKTW